MFYVITQTFQKVKYKFEYSKKASWKARSDGPMNWSWNSIKNWEMLKNILKIKNFKNPKFLTWNAFFTIFSDKAVKIKPESFFWWKIVLICHIACPKWIKIVDFRGFLHFRAENPGFRVKILKLQFLQKGSMKNFKNCTKQTPTLYIFMGGMSLLCSWKKLISPQKPTVGP